MAEISGYEEQITKQCEDLGEAEVRKRLNQGVYAGKNLRYVEGWLARLETERSLTDRAANASSASIQTELARAAADAARDSADAARDQAEAAREANVIAQRANIIATVALIAAVIAIAISIIAIFAG